MAIYHCCVKIISRGSKRSSVGAAAYRAGAKLLNDRDGLIHDYTRRRDTISAAAYRSGERLTHDDITHDFTIKKGIAYSEIMLPDHAPKEYQDRSTLWNAVEQAEKQHNAQTAREVEISLPNELNMAQQIKLVQDYVRENFVDKGMCADFSIHAGHKHPHTDEETQEIIIKKDNPHAHIMLTIRPLNDDGTWGAKSKKEYMLDKYGDRIKLPSGEWKSYKVNSTNWNDKETLLKWRENWAVTVNKEFERLGINERIDHRSLEAQGIDREPTIYVGRSPERARLNEEIKRRNKARKPEAVAERMHGLKERYLVLDKKINAVNQDALDKVNEARGIRDKADDIVERVEHIRQNEKRLEELKAERQSMGIFVSKKAIDEDIQRLEYMLTHNIATLKQKYYITPDEAPAKMRRLEYQAKDLDIAGEQLRNQLEPLKAERTVVEIEYQRHMLLSKLRPDWAQIQGLLKHRSQAEPQSASIQEKMARIRGEGSLEAVTERNFAAILQNVTAEQARKLTAQRNREREKERGRRRIPERWR